MIGKIEKVPLRDIWKSEARDFTQWMENNIDVLSQSLDFQILNVEREKTTGNFNVDLVGEDDTGGIVVIENQLEKSNHDHLGKLVTYLASIGAGKAVWIVSEPREEHKKAISWLNESTSASFYLLKVEGIRIGMSPPAPLFTLIVGPSEEIREAGETKKQYAERHHERKQFWTFLLERAKLKSKLHANISPSIYSWIGTGAGIAGITYNYCIGMNDAKVELYIDKDKEDGKGNKDIFDKIFQHEKKIEEEFGSPLSWERLDNKRASRIARYFDEGGYRDPEKWPQLTDDMIDSMIRLERVLSGYLSKLK